jgi:NAD-dependent SIR2 family protein deacetylase
MRIGADINTIEADDFARRFSMRGGDLMWLLGAGASASAGVPTAWDMVWEFKQQLYISQRRVAPKSVADLSNPAIRSLLQGHIDACGRYPAADEPDEYASLFEAAWPNERDRRTYIDGKISGAKPSYGHLAIATLMKAGLAKAVWTTNFDTLVADAAAKVYDSTAALTTIALDAPQLAAQAISSQRWPVEIKIHGDFRSRRLKNTTDELRQQDAGLRRELIDACRRFGMVVAGYSGRDESVMDALAEALTYDAPFPAGLFWLHRGDDPPHGRVLDLLRQAASKGVDGGIVTIVNFDEALRDLIRLCQGLDSVVLDKFAMDRRRWTAPARASGRRGWPVVRLNGLPLTEIPTHCRRVACNIGGYAAIRSAVETAGVNVLVGRVRSGVLAFGQDADVRAAFGRYGISEFDLHAIDPKRLRFDSGERGLLRAALSTALAREYQLDLHRQRSTDLLAPNDPNATQWAPLRGHVNALAGLVDGDRSLKWKEGVGIRLDWADDRLWLLIEPRTIFEGLSDSNRHLAADFGRERTVRRYNKQLNNLIGFWASHFAKDGGDLRALGVGNGVDAVFRLAIDTGYSRRSQA